MSSSDETRFAEVYRDHLGLILKTARAFAVEPADRDDLLQEILTALWRALPRFDGQAKLSTYVYRVALSSALNWKRSSTRYRRKLDRFTQMLSTAGVAAGSPADEARLSWLYDRIRELSPIDRSLILLSLDRVSYGEIATITGMSESHVGVRLHRIRQQLKEQSEEVRDEN